MGEGSNRSSFHPSQNLVAEQAGFERNVGLFMAVMIGIGAMMGSKGRKEEIRDVRLAV